ncbi:hypothetical protein FE392_18105 [Xenorhabdus sp. 12]|uniref:T3SS secreted effector EspK n=1 Tax=Xenorhabdus santafensis TaxID=2582833 RepID=A0ABU4SEJ9_9GAMM|nr:hypothetical protein [Xenorhabdus sp. 12]MDX7989199.1 hypothetical protein [Xenorhabdus sp. 12]
MPFAPESEYRRQFSPGDLIYGLNDQRNIYANNTSNDYFELARRHRDLGAYPPVVIDNYLTPTDIECMSKFEKEYNSKLKNNDWLNHDEKKEYKDTLNNMRYRKNYAQGSTYTKYEVDFFDHLKKDRMYEVVLQEQSPSEIYNLIMGKKCKGGLSWVCTGTSELVNRMHIHFILDGIDLKQVIHKQSNSITGKELRWIYRNRNNPLVAKKIQFWILHNPTCPPWMEEPGVTDWQAYIPQEDYSGAFARLFHLP